MIFFVIDGANRADVSPVTDLTAFRETYPRFGDTRLVAWNEVYPTGAGADPYAALRAAVQAAAHSDAACREVADALALRYGLDSMVTGPAWWVDVVTETLENWANPRIGNISANWDAPAVRPAGPASYGLSWDGCDFLDAATKAAIQHLDATLGAPRRSARDQVRICFHVIDLARAFVGELAAYVPKQIEKVHALDLCASAALEADLVGLLTVLRDLPASIPASFSFRQTEYCRYYLADVLGALEESPPGTQAAILEALWDTAIGRPPDPLPDRYAECDRVWTLLPPVVRATVLLNDIRKTLLAASGREFRLSATRAVQGGPVYGFDAPSESIPLRIAAGQRGRSGWRYVEHWTRDERHPATRSARRMLAPTWAGPSGHVAKNVDFYRMYLGNAYPGTGDRAIPAGLFALWRLYYDRRYSPTHTLVEVCEGTTYNADLSGVRRSLADVGAHDAADVYGLWAGALVHPAALRMTSSRGRYRGRVSEATRPVVDGAALLEMSHRRYYVDAPGAQDHEARAAAVATAVDERRTALTEAGYVVPRWSHESDPASTGTSAAPFRPPAAPGGRRRRRP